MVDLNGQYLKIKKEVDKAIQNVIDTSSLWCAPGLIEHSSFTEMPLYFKFATTS